MIYTDGSCYQSLELFVSDVAQTMKVVLDKYSENSMYVLRSRSHLSM